MRTHGDDARAGDGGLFRSALASVRRHTGVDVAFGGPVADGTLRLAEFHGARTRGLLGLRVAPGLGLGGHVLTSARPAGVPDYATATSITHDYDDPVLGEGLRGVLASPVLVGGQVRGVLYAAVRTESLLADRATDTLVRVSRHLADELRIEETVRRRVRAVTGVDGPRRVDGEGAPVREPARELQAEVRRIARDVDDPALRERLLRACARADGDDSPDTAEALAPRERDVLAEVARGLTNPEIAERLALRPETVKAYLRSAMRKLDVHSRHHAVAAARRAGLLA